MRQLYAYVHKRDFYRVAELARIDGVSVSAFIRGAVNDYLESVGEKPLEPIAAVGRRKKTSHAA